MSNTYLNERKNADNDDFVSIAIGTILAQIVIAAIDTIAANLKGEVRKSLDYR